MRNTHYAARIVPPFPTQMAISTVAKDAPTTSEAVNALPTTKEDGKRAALLDLLAVTVACAVFLSICLYQITLPGLYTDEAFDVIPTMQMLLGHPVELQRNVLHLGSLSLPLMSSSDYQGVTSTYLALPFFMIGGINVVSLRVMTVLVGALAIVLAFFLARSWFGRAEARLTVLLLATSPGWIFWSRLGVYVVSEVVPIGTGALLAFTAWVRRRPFGDRNGQLYLGMFLLGLGLTTKLLFLWFIAAAAVCAVIIWGLPVWEQRKEWLQKRVHWLRIAILAGIAFCVGAFPFLLYNLLTRGTYLVLRQGVSSASTSQGVNNTALLRNLWTETDAFRVLLDGSYFWFQGVFGRVYFNPLTLSAFALSAVGLAAIALTDRRRGEARSSRLVIVGGGSLAIALLVAIMIALTSVGQTPALLAAVVILLSIAGVAAILAATLRREGGAGAVCLLLLAVTAVAGAVWWLGGSGRPEGAAPGAWLGLWPIDTVGIVFWLAGGCLVLLMAAGRRPARHDRALAVSLAFIGLVVAQSAVTLSGLWSTHLLLLLPLPQMVIAAFAIAAGRRVAHLWRPRLNYLRVNIKAVPAILLVGSILLLDLGVDYSYHHDLALTGGGSTFSDAIYTLADYLEQRPQDKVVAMDWGFKRPLQFLTLEKVNPIEAYGYSATPSPGFYTGLRDLLTDPNTLYLFHGYGPNDIARTGTAYPRYEAFMSEVAREGKTAILEKTFTHRDGGPVYEVYSVK